MTSKQHNYKVTNWVNIFMRIKICSCIYILDLLETMKQIKQPCRQINFTLLPKDRSPQQECYMMVLTTFRT